jgi:hypothetical protein
MTTLTETEGRVDVIRNIIRLIWPKYVYRDDPDELGLDIESNFLGTDLEQLDTATLFAIDAALKR